MSQQGRRLRQLALQPFRTPEYPRGPRSAKTASRSCTECQCLPPVAELVVQYRCNSVHSPDVAILRPSLSSPCDYGVE